MYIKINFSFVIIEAAVEQSNTAITKHSVFGQWPSKTQGNTTKTR